MNTNSITRFIRPYVPLVLTGLFCLFVIIGVVQTGFVAGSTLMERWGRLQTLSIEKNQTELKQSILTNTDAVTLEDLTARAERTLPQDKDVGGILAALTRAQEVSGVATHTVSFSPGLVSSESAAKKDEDQRFSVVLLGSLEQVFSFIEYITHGRRLFSIEDIDIAFSADSQVTATVSLIAHYFSDPEISVSIDSPLTEFTAVERNILQMAENFPFISETSSSASGEFIPRDSYFGL